MIIIGGEWEDEGMRKKMRMKRWKERGEGDRREGGREGEGKGQERRGGRGWEGSEGIQRWERNKKGGEGGEGGKEGGQRKGENNNGG